jgi:Spy/CpxP family protein refolding chaperone
MQNTKTRIGLFTGFLILVLIVSTAKIAIPQQLQGFDHMPGHLGLAGNINIDELGDVLSLTEEQKDQLQGILKEYPKESRARLFDNIMPLLDADQKAVLTKIQSELEENKVPRSVIENRVNRMDDRLNLDEKQKEQLIQAFSEFGGKMLSLRNSDKNRDEARGELRNQFDELHNQLETILSPEQMDKMKEFNRGKRGRFSRNFDRYNRQQMFERIKDELDLNPDQEAQIEKILAQSQLSFREKLEKVDDRDERMEVLKAHRKEIASQISQVLTDDQQQKFEDLKDEYGKRLGPHRMPR